MKCSSCSRSIHSLPIILVLAISSAPSAAQVEFTVVPVGGAPGDVVTVAPGELVEFEIQALITPKDLFDPVDDTPFEETTGLVAFDIGVTSNLGVTQSPLTDFGPIIGPDFPFNQSLGTTMVPGSIAGITASQDINTFPAFPGVAVGEPETLARGALLTPDIEGRFDVGLEAGEIQIIDPETGLIAPATTTDVDSGFIIETQADSAVDDGLDDDSDGLRDDDRDDFNPEEADFNCAPMNFMLIGATFGFLGCLRVLQPTRLRRS